MEVCDNGGDLGSTQGEGGELLRIGARKFHGLVVVANDESTRSVLFLR